jgi:hypothetical protein
MLICKKHLDTLVNPPAQYELTSKGGETKRTCKMCSQEKRLYFYQRHKEKLRRKRRDYYWRNKKPRLTPYHPNQKVLLGMRFGKLTVVADCGSIEYNSRKQILWECLCECGGKIKLPTDKLPHKKKHNTKIPQYTSCEKCRHKICPLCWNKYPYSHTSKICPSKVCQAELRQMADERSIKKRSERYKTNLEYRAIVLENARAYWAENANKYNAQRTERFLSLSPAQQDEYIKKQKSAQRKSVAKRKLKEFLEISNQLLNKKD